MREELREIVRRGTPRGSSMPVNLGREYLQARTLLALQEAGAMIPLACQGGTALRFLFGLPRFSEDLDFALERPERAAFDLERTAQRVRVQLEREGYEVGIEVRSKAPVQGTVLSFPELLHELGLSPHRDQSFRVRIDVDTQPPAGAGLATTIVRRHALLNLQHHDQPSLLAGKLHAVLQRSWAKGRDLFDLFWYLSDPTWPQPNLVLLNNALEQTQWKGPRLDASNWRSTVRNRVAAMDWKTAKRDVEPFLEPGPATALFGRESLLQVLSRPQ
jgi:Nucleotidyl transferase AbiEii toxin, Type IV TA system